MKERDLVEVYHDGENNLKLVGVAVLEEQIKKLPAFIPKYICEGKRNVSRVYCGESWKVSFLTLTPYGQSIAERRSFQHGKIRT